ncbi:hypothetical protein GCM10007913_17280 [Devosia yakushimensis]|uniref:Uncharacterized protein n=1 Tax=Devosia yakushimensis TaxID=470028 RepID=A0ABQ5UD49_9HYPH|nr:hypothetical protein [Devosia yakushimensis]GLQ09796.1 hypothetical protein GCM10007913_17280 [Devosia yakushimensis]
MFDIYFVPSSCSAMPEDPRGLEHAGSIDLAAHRSLAPVLDQCRQAGADLSYFDDTLLRPDQVLTMLGVFNANADTLGAERGPRAAFETMHGMLARAAKQGMGLAAFCD